MCAFVHRALVVAVVLVAAAIPALPQEVGLVSGRVTDERGVSLEGVVVTISSPGLPGIVESVTDRDGRYWFRAVPGSHPLTLRAQTPGKVPVQYEGHTARRNGVVRIDFKLRSPGQHDILVLIEEGVPYHDLALGGAISTMPGHISTLRIWGSGPQMVHELNSRLLDRPSAVLAIGNSAAQMARRHIRDVPVVYCMVPAPMDADLTTRNMCGVPLNGGFGAQLEHLLHVAPETRRLGTVYNPHRMGRCLRELKEEASIAGVDLFAAQVHGDDLGALEAALERLSEAQLDAFLVLLEPEIMDAESFEAVARFARSEDLVLAVPDQSLVQSEKSFSFVPGFWDLGAYAGTLVRRIVEGDAQPLQIGMVYPDARTAELAPQPLERRTPRDVLPAAETVSLMALVPEE